MKRIILLSFAVIGAGVLFLLIAEGFTRPLDVSVKADLIVVEKGKRLMHIFSDGKKLKSYHISLGKDPVGNKVRQGDNKTPEGLYHIKFKDPNSRFHKAMLISYPDERQRNDAAEEGIDPGGSILIHGITNGLGWIGKAHLLKDWTRGCIAVTNREIDELFEIVGIGVSVDIKP